MVNVLKQGASKKSILTLFEKLIKSRKAKGIDAYSYCGKIKLKKDALTFQRELRNEWK